jgi:hypothetical protein
MSEAFFFVLKDTNGNEVGQVEARVRGGKFCFEVQRGFDVQDPQEFAVPISIFKKGRRKSATTESA